MKKILDRLLVFGLGVAALSGCDFFGFGGVDEKGVEGLDLRDYRTATVLNSTYEFSGHAYLTYEDGHEIEVTEKCSYPTLDTSKLGKADYKVSYEGKQYIYTKTITINIVESIDLLSIDAVDYTDTVEAKQTYVFDGKVIASYSDSSTKDVTDKANIGSIDTSTAGNKKLGISYTENNVNKQIEKTIKVTKKLTGITISNYQNAFEVGDTFSFTGKVYANYSDDSKVDVTSSAVIDSSAVNTSTLGNYTFGVSYTVDGQTFTATGTVSVTAHIPVLQSISASGYSTQIDKPSKYVFDGTVMAHFDEGDDKDVTADCTYSINLAAGTQTLTIRYTDPNHTSITKSTTASITIISHVTGITVDNNTLNIGVGKTKTFVPTVAPSDASNKNITISSSNTSVATVSSAATTSGTTITVTGKAVGSAVITVASVEYPSITASLTVNVLESVADAWTVMIYMCGANLESDDSLATSDIEEILGISGQPDDVNIIIETGGSKSWHTPSSYLSGATSVPNSQLGRWHVENNKLVKDSFITNADMSAKETYKSFLQWGLDNYPADKVGVILWNHGAGLEGVCLDEKMNDGYHGLINSEMQWAHSQVITDKLEFIGFDACLMQNMEIADFNAPYFNYQIASQQLENGEGWYYTGWIDDLYAKRPTTTILSQACSTFVAKEGGDQTLSYLNLSYASTFKTAFENYASALKAKLASSSVSGSDFADYVTNNVKLFGESDAMGYGQFDIVNWVNKCQTQSKYKVDDSIASAVTNALSTGNYVGQNSKGSSAGQSNGLSLNYRCLSSLAYDASETSFTNWLSFNNTYYGSGGWY